MNTKKMRYPTIVFLFIICVLLFPITKPNKCSICDSLPCHAPCLLNLKTGQLDEMSVYEPHATKVGEISEVQNGGYWGIRSYAGSKGFCLAADRTTVRIPTKAKKWSRRYFCRNCRELLRPFRNDGYVLLDLKNTDRPIIYQIEEGLSFSVRCYDINILEMQDGTEYEIVVLGHRGIL